MSINLAEAVKLKSIITKKIQELNISVHQVTHVVIEKGQEPKQPALTLEKLETDLKTVTFN